MNEELIDLLFDYIDCKVDDVVNNHRCHDHNKGAYWSHYDSAGKVKEQIYKTLKESK